MHRARRKRYQQFKLPIGITAVAPAAATLTAVPPRGKAEASSNTTHCAGPSRTATVNPFTFCANPKITRTKPTKPKPKPKPKKRRASATPTSVVRLNPWTKVPVASPPSVATTTAAFVPRAEREARAAVHHEADVAFQAAQRARARVHRAAGQHMMLAGIPLASYVSNGEGTITAPLPPTPREALAEGFPWEQAFMPRHWNDLLFANQETNTCQVVLQLLTEIKRQLALPPPSTTTTRGSAPKVIVLMGPPGCGKTALLRLLGEKLQVRVRWLNTALDEVPRTAVDARGRSHILSLEAEVKQRMENLCRTTATRARPRKDLIVLDGFAMLSTAERAAFLAGVVRHKQRRHWAPLVFTVTTPVPSTFWSTFKRTMCTKFTLPRLPRVVVKAALTQIAKTLGKEPRDLLFWMDTVEGDAYGDLRQAMQRAQMGILGTKLAQQAQQRHRVQRVEDLSLGTVETQLDVFQAGALMFTPIAPRNAVQARWALTQRLAAASTLDGLLLFMMSANLPVAGKGLPMHATASDLEWLSALDQLPWMATWAKDLMCEWAVRAAHRASASSKQRWYRVKDPFPVLRLATGRRADKRNIIAALVDTTQELMVALLQRHWDDARTHLLTLAEPLEQRGHGKHGRVSAAGAAEAGAGVEVVPTVLPVCESHLWASVDEGRRHARGAQPPRKKRRTRMEIDSAARDTQVCMAALATAQVRPARDGGSVTVETLQVPPLLGTQASPSRQLAHAQMEHALAFGIARVRGQRSWHLHERGFFGASRFK